MASEVVETMRWTGEEVVFKVDFEKAYDCMDWDFLVFMLGRIGFGARWTGWIKRYVMCTRVLVLVNGSVDDKFSIERGLKQGCPLSLLLFNLVVKCYRYW